MGKRVELDPRDIAALPPRDVTYEVADSRVVGLRAVVQPSGFKSFAVRYVFDGRTRKLTLGPFPRIKLKQARRLASAALLSVHSGKDPGAEKIEARRRQNRFSAGCLRPIRKGAFFKSEVLDSKRNATTVRDSNFAEMAKSADHFNN